MWYGPDWKGVRGIPWLNWMIYGTDLAPVEGHPCWNCNKLCDNQNKNRAQISGMEVLTSKNMVTCWVILQLMITKQGHWWECKGSVIDYTRTRGEKEDCARLGNRRTTVVPPAKGRRRYTRKLEDRTSEVPCFGYRVPAMFGWKEIWGKCFITLSLKKINWVTELFCCSVVKSCLTLWLPWTVAHQVPLSSTVSLSLLRFMSVEWVMLSVHLILCHPLLLLPSVFPSIRVLSSELALHVRWPEYESFSFSISPSSEYPELISFSIDWCDLLAVQGPLRSLFHHHRLKASFFPCSAFFIQSTGLILF